MKTASRNPQLDILRGLAVLLVLGRHFPAGTVHLSGWAVNLIKMWHRIGWSGVDLFFVLSGFLVSGLLFGEFQSTGRIALKRFLIRRGLRIYPVFYLMIFLSIIFLWRKIRLIQVFVEVFFLQSYAQAQNCIWQHTWTLAIEEHFYFGLGIILLILSKNRGRDPFRLIPFLWLLAAFLCLLFRLQTPYDVREVFTPTHVRIDALLFGVTLAYFYHFHQERLALWVKHARIFLGLGTVLFLSPIFLTELRAGPFLTRFGLTGSYLGFGLLLLLFLFNEKPAVKNPSEKIFAFVGVRSYSIYLWHVPVLLLAVKPLGFEGASGFWWAGAIYLMGSVAAGCISYEWVERPILVWRDRHYPASGKALWKS